MSVPMYVHTYIYIAVMLYPRKGSRGIQDIPPRHPRFTKLVSYEEHCRRDRW
jgi:hypothetical protein